MSSLVNFRPVFFPLLTPALWLDLLIFFSSCSLNPFCCRKITSCLLSGPPMSLILSFDSLYPQNIYLIIRSSWSCMMDKIFPKAPLELLISETSIWGPLVTFVVPHPPGPWKDAYALEMEEISDPMLCPGSGERMPWYAWFRVQVFHLNLCFWFSSRPLTVTGASLQSLCLVTPDSILRNPICPPLVQGQLKAFEGWVIGQSRHVL